MTPSDPVAALEAVAAAASIRSAPTLWLAIERAMEAGAGHQEINAAIETAAQTAAEAVRREAETTLREVLARQGARERWSITTDEER